MTPSLQNWCFFVGGASLATVLASHFPSLFHSISYRSLATVVLGARPAERKSGENAFTSLPLEVFEQILMHCNAYDIPRIALTSSRMAYLTRPTRWRKITIKPGQAYFSLREWSIQVTMAQTRALRSLQVIIPGLEITFPLPHSLREDFREFLRELVLPTRWTPESVAFFIVLAALRPPNVRTIAFGSESKERDWFSELQRVWVPDTMDALMASAKALRFVNATRGGLHFVLGRRPSQSALRMCDNAHTVEIRDTSVHAQRSSNAQWSSSPREITEWSDLGWGVVVGPEAEMDMRVNAKSLHVDLMPGVRTLLQYLHFPSLQVLSFCFGALPEREWPLVARLISDSASSIQEICFLKGSRSDLARGAMCPIHCDLPSLRIVRTHWKVLDHVLKLKAKTAVGKVDIVVEGYFSCIASTDDYTRAAQVLRGGHWGRIVFLDTPFLQVSVNKDMRNRRHAELKEALQLLDILFI